MKPLFKLWFLKTKGSIRNLFKSKISGVFTIIIILSYAAMIVGLFTLNSSGIMTANSFDLHVSVLLLIGFQALLLFTTLMQSKKALLFGEDAFYLFSGPFTRKQIMSYLTFQTVVQAITFSFFGILILSGFSNGNNFSVMFIILAYLAQLITTMFVTLLNDYLYILSIGDKKYQKVSKLIPVIIIVFVLAIILFLYIQTGNYQTLLIDFVQSNLFYLVPVFGWMKLALISFAENNYLLTILGFALLSGAFALLYWLFISYSGDFYEQALADSIDFSKRMKAARAGNQDALRDKKVKVGVKGTFYQGAYAVMSKNILLMKKTNSLISSSDMLTIALYLVLTMVINLGFGVFIYMMVIWIFSSLQASDLTKELKNYQIYLIPDKPFRKLMALIIPIFLKIVIIATISFIIIGVYYQENMMTIISYLLNVLGYTGIFISGNVLSIRILKSRSSMFFETFIRIIIMIIGAIPSAVIIAVMLALGNGSMILMLASYAALFVNFIISFLILFVCRNMMNGRELKSE